MDKFEYFNQLQALQESSDEEPESNELRRCIRNVINLRDSHQKRQNHIRKYVTPRKISKICRSPSSPISNPCLDKEVIQSFKEILVQKKASTSDIVTPSTKQNNLEPPTAQSFVEETPQILWQKNTLSENKWHAKLDNSSNSQNNSLVSPTNEDCYKKLSKKDEVSTPITAEPSLSFRNEILVPNSEIVTNRSELIPSIGSVVMNNSSGIKFMLRKRKRKNSSVKLVPEKDRIFAGQMFLFIPTNDIAPLRRKRIAKAKSYGALWTKEWSPSVTHIVVDKNLNYKQMMAYLKPILGPESIPSNVIFVNDEYPNECVNFRCVLDPLQERYAVVGSEIRHLSDRSKSPNSVSDVLNQQNHIEDIESCQENTAIGSRTKILSQGLKRNSNLDTSKSPFIKEIPASSNFKKKSQDELKINLPQNHVQNSPRRDPLDDMLDIARNLKYLPIEDEEDENNYEFQKLFVKNRLEDHSQKSNQDTNPDFEKSDRALTKNERFLCMEDGKKSNSDENPNGETIRLLKELSDYYDRIHDEWRSKGYRKAIRTLKRHPTKISSYSEAIQLPNIGHRLAQKIEEIALTHRLRRLESAKISPEDELLQKFLGIYGVGLSQASKWIAAGYKSLKDLDSKAKLTENQRLGIEHYSDFNTRIPRTEVTAIRDIIQDAVLSLDSRYSIEIAGSYRRGSSTCGDIDVIITRQNTSEAREITPFLLSLVDYLTKNGVLVAALVKPGPNGSKWHGACVMPGSKIWRRIDFLAVPASEYGAALLYFTGDNIFNRSIRLLSRKKGMRLNQHGLYRDVMHWPESSKSNRGTLVESADEKRIFEILGVPWRSPEQRSHN